VTTDKFENKLIIHSFDDTQGRNYTTCDVCGMLFAERGNIMRHRRKRTENICDILMYGLDRVKRRWVSSFSG